MYYLLLFIGFVESFIPLERKELGLCGRMNIDFEAIKAPQKYEETEKFDYKTLYNPESYYDSEGIKKCNFKRNGILKINGWELNYVSILILKLEYRTYTKNTYRLEYILHQIDIRFQFVFKLHL